jgi:hypothetical protein
MTQPVTQRTRDGGRTSDSDTAPPTATEDRPRVPQPVPISGLVYRQST